MVETINGCKNNPENIFLSEHIPSGVSMSTISSFGSIENKHNVFRVLWILNRACNENN